VTPRAYLSPEAFKQALEQRLRSSSATGGEMARRRQLVVFERFLARVDAEFGDRATLKGGLVLELRLERARTTKDVDLRLTGSYGDLLSHMRDVVRRDMHDFMTFEIDLDAEQPEIRNEGMQYDGYRFRATCLIADKPYGAAFGVDIAFGDPLFGEPDVARAKDVLAFAGIASPAVRLYPIETHIAEKLHAYTIPRLRPNSRIKDLPDIALLATVKPLDATRLRAAFKQTFAFRKTHDVPRRLPRPADGWAAPFAAIARNDQLPWTTLDVLTDAVAAFLDPVLGSEPIGSWDPAAWMWTPQAGS
jgi:hypothetical protein